MVFIVLEVCVSFRHFVLLLYGQGCCVIFSRFRSPAPRNTYLEVMALVGGSKTWTTPDECEQLVFWAARRWNTRMLVPVDYT
jgi:hypothetical protein